MDEIIVEAKSAVVELLKRARHTGVKNGDDALAYASAAQVAMQIITFAVHNENDEKPTKEMYN